MRRRLCSRPRRLRLLIMILILIFILGRIFFPGFMIFLLMDRSMIFLLMIFPAS